MNGSRSISPRHGEQSSLDALNRTIEGLEARIEGLMKAPRAARFPVSPDHGMDEHSSHPKKVADPLQEIRDRQRMLAAARTGQAPQPAESLVSAAAPRPRIEGRMDPRRGEPRQHSPRRAPVEQTGASLQDIIDTLSNLRDELRKDVADGVAQEMETFRAEVRGVKAAAQGHHAGDDLRRDLARLAESIRAMDQREGPAADMLRAEYEELRAAVGGLAREESLRHLDARWQEIEERVLGLDARDLRQDLAGLAYRIDEIKGQLGSLSDGTAIRALEQKLLAVAAAMEQIGSRMQPTDASLHDQFLALDERLDEISRAIAANGRHSAGTALDHTALQRLENRIGMLAEQLHGMARSAPMEPAAYLSDRIEALSNRIEQLSNEETALRLEERLEQLQHMLSDPRRSYGQAEFAGFLAEISEKLEGLSEGHVNVALLERLDHLVRRIDQLESPVREGGPAFEGSAIGRIEERLGDIAARLDETVQGPLGESPALKSLEAQIAHLSALMSEPSRMAPQAAPEIESRVTALEGYMSTNDEYIIEAARQAAEAVVESFARRGGAGAPPVDTGALAALAEDLRHLEELTRSTEERSQHTLDALHSTLVQIADRLDAMEDRILTPVTQRSAVPTLEPAGAQAPHAEPRHRMEVPPLADVNDFHDDFNRSLAGSTAHSGTGHSVSAALKDDEHPVDITVSPDEPAAVTEAGAAPKGGLLAQISRRLRSGPKQAASKPGRTLVDPAPSLDPVDLLPPERENEPLEPGSGTPDVRKILERVRASQAATAGERSQAAVGDRADYIAAARRAAKAAAMETDPALEGAGGRRNGKAAAGGKSAGISFARHRRPIMMAVGAVLLVMMAMPLVKNLTSSQDAQPQPPLVDETSARGQVSVPKEAAPVAAGMAAEAPAALSDPKPEAKGRSMNAAGAADGAAATGVAASTRSEPAPPVAAQTSESAAATPERPEEAPEQAEATAVSDAEPAQQTIVVPAGVGPESLVKAAQSGDPTALFEIGARYTEGRGVGVDLSEAANWYKLAADRGLAPAQYRLGNLFEKGNGIERDLDKAVAYYQQAADAGNASAMHNLAVLNASGVKGEPDYAAAVGWFRKAAELGVSDSQFNLAILYARGNGTPQDLIESYKWFAIAAKGGDADAAQKRDEVAKAMRKEQLDAAHASADSWKPKEPSAEANSVELPDEWAGEKPVKTSSVDMDKAIRNIQAILNKNGFDAGTPDGKMGQKTIAAIKAFQTSLGQEATGRINDALVKELLARNT